MTGRGLTVRAPRTMRLTSAAGSLLLTSCSLAGAALPAEGRVAVSITPGKPDAPTETVTVIWRDGRGSIRSERRGTGGEALAAGEADLDEERIRELWRAVARSHLTTFEPRPAAGQVFDFGNRHVRLEWTPRSGGPRQAHDFSWIKPLDNEGDVRPLLRAAGDAARTAVPGVTLSYFPATRSSHR